MTHEAIYEHGLSKDADAGMKFRKNMFNKEGMFGSSETTGFADKFSSFSEIAKMNDEFYSKKIGDRGEINDRDLYDKMREEDREMLKDLDVYEDGNGNIIIADTENNKRI